MRSKTRDASADFGFRISDIFLWIGMLYLELFVDDSTEAESWFHRGGGNSSNPRSWLQLSDFFSHLKMFNLCIAASLHGLRIIDDDGPYIVRLRLCTAVAEAQCCLGRVGEAIRFTNVAIQEFHTTAFMRRRRRIKDYDASEPLETLALALEVYKSKQERLLRWRFGLSDSVASAGSAPAEAGDRYQDGRMSPAVSGGRVIGGRRQTFSSMSRFGSDAAHLNIKEVIGMHLALLGQMAWVYGDRKLAVVCCMQITGKLFPVTEEIMAEVRVCTSRCSMDYHECVSTSLNSMLILCIK